MDAATGNTYDDLISSESSAQSVNSKPTTLGIAFGGGGICGFMLLGVIKALEEENIHANVVTNLNEQKSMLITKGKSGHAMQASSSIPGAFVPVDVQAFRK